MTEHPEGAGKATPPHAPRPIGPPGRPHPPEGARAEFGARTPLGLQWQLALAGLGFGIAAALAPSLYLGRLPSSALPAAAVLAVAGAVLGFFFGRPIKRDIREIAIYAAALAHGQLGVRLPEASSGDLRHLMRELNRTAEALARQVDALRRLSDQRATLEERSERLAVLEERQRLARELHDTVSQELFALAMSVAAARDRLPESLAAERDRLRLAEEGARRAQITMRNLIGALRPVELGGQRLGTALQDLLRDAEQRRGVRTSLALAEGLDLPTGIEDAVFRIAQEALSNALRHGAAGLVAVTLGRTGARVHLTVRDDGQGFDEAELRAGYGIRGMRERAAEVGGRLDISARPGSGCTVHFWLDLEEGTAT